MFDFERDRNKRRADAQIAEIKERELEERAVTTAGELAKALLLDINKGNPEDTLVNHRGRHVYLERDVDQLNIEVRTDKKFVLTYRYGKKSGVTRPVVDTTETVEVCTAVTALIDGWRGIVS